MHFYKQYFLHLKLYFLPAKPVFFHINAHVELLQTKEDTILKLLVNTYMQCMVWSYIWQHWPNTAEVIFGYNRLNPSWGLKNWTLRQHFLNGIPPIKIQSSCWDFITIVKLKLAANIENQADSLILHPLVLCLSSDMADICMKWRKKYFRHYGNRNLKVPQRGEKYKLIQKLC